MTRYAEPEGFTTLTPRLGGAGRTPLKIVHVGIDVYRTKTSLLLHTYLGIDLDTYPT